ncbi:hypothetical protein RI054_43g151220 [Pseudoscourfieldia marina]
MGSGSFRHGTGSAGEQRPEQPLLNDEEREDLVVIAQNSPLASQRLSARRALLDDATLRQVILQMEETTTSLRHPQGCVYLSRGLGVNATWRSRLWTTNKQQQLRHHHHSIHRDRSRQRRHHHYNIIRCIIFRSW